MRTYFLLTLALMLTLAACAPASTPTLPPASPVTVDSSTAVPATEVSAPPAETQTYTDSAYGFSFDYPAAWMLDVVTLGDRAPHSIQLTSWQHEPGMISEVPAGATIVNVTVQRWDPKGDLAAFGQHMQEAWNNSGNSVVSQSELSLADGRAAQEYVLHAADGEGYFLLTTLGDNYLVVSGSGNVETLRQIGRSLR